MSLEADEHGNTAAADAALARAREIAPASPRSWVQAGQRAARAGQHALALATWTELRQRHPGAFALVAEDYAKSALAEGQANEALATLTAMQAERASLELLRAIDTLDSDTARARERHAKHLAQQPTLSAAAAVLRDAPEPQPRVIAAVEAAAKPLQRYRCAACGFEAQRYFWQCPGCLSWDSFPPQRLEDM